MSAPGRSQRRARPGALRLWLRWFGLLCVPAIVASTTSFVSTLRSTDNLSTPERSVEWLRGHHLGDVVSWVETQYYSRNQPPTGGSLPSALPNAATDAPSPAPPTGASPNVAAPTDAIAPFASPPVAGEGVWQPYGDAAADGTAMQVAYLRPDAVHGSLLAGVVRVDQRLARLHLVAGSVEPGHGPWPGGATVTGSDRAQLLAAFNSGFRIADARGGFAQGGHVVGTLRTGAASLVISPTGTADVVRWTPAVAATKPAAVRQNLDLIVEDGQRVAGLDDNTGDRWGRTVGNTLFVWRSGLGIDSAGRLLYVASSGLSVSSLAALLRRAGAVRAMELDINPSWVTLNSFHHDAAGLHGTKLLASMNRSASRYLTADARDFVAVIARGPLTRGAGG
jgi:hypothetical protein